MTACHSNEPQYETKYTRTFNEIWECLDSKYVFFDMMQCNWDSLHTVYVHRINAVENDNEFQNEITAMLTAIGDPMIFVRYAYSGLQCPNTFWAKDRANRLFAQKHETYEILDGTENVGFVIFSVGRIIRTDDANNVTGIYDAVYFDPNIADSFGSVGGLFKRYIQTYYNDGRAKGLILDMRSCAWMDIAFASAVLESLYPQNKEYTIYVNHRSGAQHNAFIKIQDYSISGLGYYENKPIVILINRETMMSPHVVASVLSELPNVTIVGREADSGRGGVLQTKLFGDTINVSQDYMTYPGIYLSDAKHTSFNAPLQPDIFVDWDISTLEGYYYDKCIDTALDCIDAY